MHHLVMTEALPKGIVTSTENISSEIEALDRVDIEDIAQLWRGRNSNLPCRLSNRPDRANIQSTARTELYSNMIQEAAWRTSSGESGAMDASIGIFVVPR